MSLKTRTVNDMLTILIPGRDLIEDFYIDQIPVTVGAYKRCTASGACKTQHYNRYGYANYYENSIFDIFPMSFVTFEEASTYCRAYGGDLPTEAQWLLAAGSADYAWGDRNPTLSKANIDGYYQWQTPAGWLPDGTDAYGVLDLNGNVREWVLDKNPENSSEQELKGGAFQDSFGSGKNDFTFYHEPTSSGFNRGFRCVYPR